MKKSDRTRVYNKYGKRCAYCGRYLEYKDMQVDHLIPRLRGRRPASVVKVFENWMPSCRRCNHYKHSYPLEHFRSLLLTLHKRINKIYIAKVAKDYGIIQDAVAWDGVFYFEEYEEEQRPEVA